MPVKSPDQGDAYAKMHGYDVVMYAARSAHAARFSVSALVLGRGPLGVMPRQSNGFRRRRLSLQTLWPSC